MARKVVDSIQRFMHLFLPKEEEFFCLFGSMAEHAAVAAVELQALLESYPDVEAHVAKIHELEDNVDDLRHDCVGRLHETFVTPIMFDRQDIFDFADILDDVVDFIKAAADRVSLYEPISVPTAVKELAAILVEATAVLQTACAQLEDLRPQQAEFVHRVNELENQADRVLKRGLADLFKNTPDAVEIMKWKEIYDYVEEAIDHCEDTANLIEGTLVKNS